MDLDRFATGQVEQICRHHKR